MEIKEEFIERTVAGEHLLIPVGSTAAKISGIITLSDCAAFIWKLLPEAPDEEWLTLRVTEEYSVDRKTAAADISDFLYKLKNTGII